MKYIVILLIATAAAVGIYYYRQQPTPNQPIVEKQQVTITGEVVCLPHKNTKDGITLECAYGIKDAQGTYYGLRDTSTEEIPPVNMGETVTVQGLLIPNPESQYDIAGVIETDLTQK